MPTRNRNFLRMLLPFGLLAVAVLTFIRRKGDDWEYETAEEDAAVRAVPVGTQTGRRRSPTARLALVAAFTSLFFAGAAFTAGAGDQLAKMLDPDDAAALEAANQRSRRGRSRSRGARGNASEVGTRPLLKLHLRLRLRACTPEAAPGAPELLRCPSERAGGQSRRPRRSRRLPRRKPRSQPRRLPAAEPDAVVVSASARKERRELAGRSVGRRRAQGTGRKACTREGEDSRRPRSGF